ncbi:metalloregulator ArsR/SmtB family transcription factor [Georgenia halophila]|uniref:ArsR/SmtB family transcription factor n=1 Tax=Georgenia halophila TaxID=620889 RepID=UPI0031E8A5C1
MDPWTALGDPSRRRIFQRLTERPSSVSELAAELPISRPAVSQHLRVLRQAALVEARTAGTRHIYEVDAAGLRALQADLDRFWGQALSNLKALAEQQPATNHHPPANHHEKEQTR